MSVLSTARDAAKTLKQGETAIAERQRARLARAGASARADAPFYRELYRDRRGSSTGRDRSDADALTSDGGDHLAALIADGGDHHQPRSIL